ncbi:alpha/beta-hydrolase [Pluteus cervinus]|uniref:Alpha/beta-hydrolase n=1 Tax=Pluteus cervinus TaxID=181527 RepID=A0ACD3AY48_9AGAR|nr:alpha/beta-hydrolase [Pluteus cervinus]
MVARRLRPQRGPPQPLPQPQNYDAGHVIDHDIPLNPTQPSNNNNLHPCIEMRSVYVPVHVVVLLRRLANVFSTFSISHHYLQGREEKLSRRGDNPSPVWRTLGVAEWSWWSHRDRWRWSLIDRIDRSRVHESSSVLSMSYPSLRRRWSISSLLSLATEPTNGSSPMPSLPRLSPDHNPPAPKRQPVPQSRPPEQPEKPDTIHALLQNPALYDPLRTPRYPLVLCHGLYGFDSRGPSAFPSLRMHYWANVLNILRTTLGAEVIVTSVPGTGSLESRSEILHERLKDRAHGRGVNFLAHSMGGLDCRHLITHIQPTDYVPLSLTSVATPHRGSPFMDWCAENLGLGKISQDPKFVRSTATQSPSSPQEIIPALTNSSTPSLAQALKSLPSSVTTLLLSMVDSPAYANLTTKYLNEVFNPRTPNDPHVKYFSVAGRMNSVNVWHPFWLPKMVLDGWEERQRDEERKYWERQGTDQLTGQVPRWASEKEWGNDGLVTVQSAKWGEFLGIIEGCDHWQIRGARGIEFGVDLPAIPVIGLGGPTYSPEPKRSDKDGWFPEWSKFMGAWRTQEKKFHEEASRSNSTFAFTGPPPVDSSTPIHSPSSTTKAHSAAPLTTPTRSDDHRQHKGVDRPEDDAVVRSATDKLSAVFDWVMQLPVGVTSSGLALDETQRPTLTPKETSSTLSSKRPQVRQVGGISAETQRRMTNELAKREDLERFYVALSRKLYDEGL